MEGVSLSDIAALNNRDDWGGGGCWWIIVLFALMFGGNGFGWGNNGFANAIGYENLATSNEVQRGFDNQNSMANQREILAAVNQSFHDTLASTQNLYNEVQRDISGLALGQANTLAKLNECCCDTLRAIDGVNYNNAMNTAAINANTTEQTQKILDAITGNRMADMQNQINALELQNALQGVVRYPNGFVYNAGSNPFCGCGCGNGNYYNV